MNQILSCKVMKILSIFTYDSPRKSNNLMKIIFVTFFIFSFTFAQGQIDTITTTQVNSYVGKDVFLKGKVVSSKNHTAKNGDIMLFIDLDKPYPNNAIGITFYSEVLSKLSTPPSQLYNKYVLVRGKINLYRDKPNMVVKNEEDLKIIQVIAN